MNRTHACTRCYQTLTTVHYSVNILIYTEHTSNKSRVIRTSHSRRHVIWSRGFQQPMADADSSWPVTIKNSRQLPLAAKIHSGFYPPKSRVEIGLKFPPSPSPLPFPFPSPGAHPLIQLGCLGSAVSSPSGSGQSPAAKRFVVHFELKISASGE